MDIPIDPALLEEEGGFEDAEGEVDDEYLAGNVSCQFYISFVYVLLMGAFQGYTSYEQEDQQVEQAYPVHYIPTPPLPRASSSRSEIAASIVDTALPKKRRGRPPGSITKNRKSDLNGGPIRAHLNGHGHYHPSSKSKGKGKARSKHHIGRADSLETIYAPHPPDQYCSFCEIPALNGEAPPQNLDKIKEKMVSCVQCGRSGHPTCLNMTPSLAKYVMTYNWMCLDCKACELCGSPDVS